MYELLWIALGVALGVAAALAAARVRRAPSTGAREEVQPPKQPSLQPRAPVQVEARVSSDAPALAKAIAEQLASLVSAVEARAQHLVEAAPTRRLLPSAADAMFASIQPLHRLHTKLIAVGRARPKQAGTTDVNALIAGLGEDLQQMQLGLELRWDPPPALPLIEVCPEDARDATLFACGALLRAERGATRLTVSTERSFSRARATIKLELNLEWITAPSERRSAPHIGPAFTLDWEAAKQLAQVYGGELTLSHLPGKAVRAVLRFPIARRLDAPPRDDTPEAPEPDAREAGRVEHDHGGALVLESDPALRAVLARELKASGRAVFVCADGESAHTFLETTPDRFELLIVDDLQELQANTPLARTIRARAPELKICLLTPTPPTDEQARAGLHTLKKPFGVHELRRTLANMLAQD